MQFLKIKLTVSSIFYHHHNYGHRILLLLISLSPSHSLTLPLAQDSVSFFSEASPNLTVSSLSSRNWEPFPVHYCRLFINFYSFFFLCGFCCYSHVCLSNDAATVQICKRHTPIVLSLVPVLHNAYRGPILPPLPSALPPLHIFRHIYLITKCSDRRYMRCTTAGNKSNAVIASFLFIYKENGV